jgi:hypothetical protein
MYLSNQAFKKEKLPNLKILKSPKSILVTLVLMGQAYPDKPSGLHKDFVGMESIGMCASLQQIPHRVEVLNIIQGY